MASKTEEKLKILFCGDVEGKFNALFKKVETVSRKTGPYDLLLCVGNFFGINNKEFAAYRNGSKKVVVPTYVLGPNKEEHVDLYDETELCPNVYYLGKRGLYTSTGGVKIAYLSGVAATADPKSYEFDSEDIKALCDVCIRGNQNYRGVDILLTSQWPQGVDVYDQRKKLLKENAGSYLNAWLAAHLKPRYHVSGLEGVFYERSPFRAPSTNADLEMEIVTRFIGLGRVAAKSQQEKYMYALSLTPIEKMKVSELLQKTVDETPCPYNLEQLDFKVLKVKKKASSSSQYFYDMNTTEEAFKKKCKREKIKFDQSKCWFCLASTNVEKHLVVSVGLKVYLAVAKGALVDEHLLICPIEHIQNSLRQSDALTEEITQFKDAVIKFYASRNKLAVFFERNYKTSHMQIQAVPIPQGAERDLEGIFKDEADGHGLTLQVLELHNRLDQVIPPKVPYFVVELPNGVVLYSTIQGSKGFPLNFGREVLASEGILNAHPKTEWKKCVLSKEEEMKLTAQVREDFKPYDFTELL